MVLGGCLNLRPLRSGASLRCFGRTVNDHYRRFLRARCCTAVRPLPALCSNPLTAESVDGPRYRPVILLTFAYQITAQCSAEKEHAALISAQGQKLPLALIRAAKPLRGDFRSIAQRNFCMAQAEDLQATRAIERPSASIAA